MGSPLQAVYATNLHQSLGYPLRTPEPENPSDKVGLRVGDVGYVNDNGDFRFLFNIRFPHDESHDVPEYKRVELKKIYTKRGVLAADRLFITGVERQPDEQKVAYKFTVKSSSGAILALPSGAALSELQNKQQLEELRKITTQYAHAWCKFAGQDSLYLVTGVYKTSSWTLGSFNNGRTDTEIFVDRQIGNSDAETFKWRSGPEVDHRSVHKNIDYENQTVLIKGFKMTVRWKLTVVEWIAGRQNALAASLTFVVAVLTSIIANAMKLFPGAATIEHTPRLSQPLHPSDLINRYLLDKNPNARVAITHDNQWIDMLEKAKLSHANLMQQGPLWVLLAKESIYNSNDGAVYLQSQMLAFFSPFSQSCIDSENSNSAHDESEYSQPTPAIENVQIVITQIRAENVTVSLGRVPIGFYVQLNIHDGTCSRTNVKSIPVCDPVIQWDDLIQLRPSDPTVTVELAIYASFEFDPVLGKGERLFTLKIDVCDLLDRTGLITISEKEGEDPLPCSSLLIAARQWHCNYRTRAPSRLDSSLHWDDSSELAKETDLGHDALRQYRRDHREEDLKSSVEHFNVALNKCPVAHPCHAAVLSNLARAMFIVYQFYGTSPSFERAIFLYREALKLRHEGHPDRPTTLLYLSQALLYHYGATGNEAPFEGELQKYIDELLKVCSEGRHERRAADLVLLTYERLRFKESDDLAELGRLISKLDVAAQEPPEVHFDRPIRLNNLGLALLRRFQLRRNPSDQDWAITCLEEAVQIMSNSDLEKPGYLSDLGNALMDRFRRVREVGDLDCAIESLEGAEQLTPDHHRAKRTYLNNLCNAYLARFQCRRVVGDLDQAISGLEHVRRLSLALDAHASGKRHWFNAIRSCL